MSDRTRNAVINTAIFAVDVAKNLLIEALAGVLVNGVFEFIKGGRKASV